MTMVMTILSSLRMFCSARRPVAAVLVVLAAPIPALGGAQTPLRPGMTVRSSVRLRPGVYRVADPGSGVLRVTGSGFTVDLRGVRIIGPGKNKGIGIHVTDAKNVTIRGANVSGCLWGVVLERCQGVRLVDCVSSHNGDLPAGTVIDESGNQPEDQHGGGFLLRDSSGCLVQRCKAQHQWDGIDVVRSNRNVVEDGDYSYSGNWGVHFWLSSRNVFRRNRAIWCTTGEGTLYQALTGWQTYDAQAVGIDHASCDNLIEDNDLRFGGDGVFIRANEGPVTPGTVVPPKHSSNRNIIRGNDCSFSPNNAIEADLVDGTVCENNNCSFSHYGLWLGYSRGTIVRGNVCVNDTAHAIEIENGQNITIENNVFGFDTNQPDNSLIYLRYNGRGKEPSGPYHIARNEFYGSGRPILLRETEATVAQNTVRWGGGAPLKLVTQETPGRVTESGTRVVTESGPNARRAPRVAGPLSPGGRTKVLGVEKSSLPLVVELDGIPMWCRRLPTGEFEVRMPADFWDRPAKSSAALRCLTSTGWSPATPVAIRWPDSAQRVEAITPSPARLGDTITVKGANLGGVVLLNKMPIPVQRSGSSGFTFRVPEGVPATSSFNLIVRDSRDPDRFSWPVSLTVDVPWAIRPHILNAVFSPTTLRVGDVLTVTFTVRNNLPVPALTLTRPESGYVYDEDKGGWQFEEGAARGTLHLRVTSDQPGGQEPGSWPWFFGFERPRLAPGETVTVVGRIRVQTPGVHEFRVGLVPTGFGFIDDNAFRTRIEVLAK